MIVYRHADPRFPFLWENALQPSGRWNSEGDGPVQYFADTPDGAWAEFLRHEGITLPDELVNIRRALWAVEIHDETNFECPTLPLDVLSGDLDSYPACQAEARRIRAGGASGIRAPSAALVPGGARGWSVKGGLRPGPPRDGLVFALFGIRSDVLGWAAAGAGAPHAELLSRVRPLLE